MFSRGKVAVIMVFTKIIFVTLYIFNMLCFFRVLSEYSALDITEVRLSECATTPRNIALHSIRDYHNNIKKCFLDIFLICTRKQASRTVEELNSRYEILGVCGVLGSYFVNSDLPWRLHLNVMSDFDMNMGILSFQLPWIHSGCPVYGMTIDGSILGKSDSRLYCGKRIPWSLIYDNKCSLAIYGNGVYPINIYLYFSLVINQKTLADISFYFLDHSTMINLYTFSRLLSRHNRVILRVVTTPYMLLMMHFQNKTDAKHFDIRDGPGNLSPFIVAHYNSRKILSSSYMVSIHLKTHIDTTTMKFLYWSKSVIDARTRHIFPCLHIGGIRSLQRGLTSDELTFRSRSTKTTACHIFYSSLSDINVLTFPKLDIIHYLYLGNTVFNESRWSSCQYGGIFAFSLSDRQEIENIYQYCNNLEDDLPPSISTEEQTLLISMVWFPPYSRGFFKGTLKMTPFKYRNITVTQSINANILHLVNYNTSGEIITLNSPKHEIIKGDMSTIRVIITNEFKFMGPTALDFILRNSSSLNDKSCIHRVILNVSYYQPWIPFLKHVSFNWSSSYGIPAPLEFGILKDVNMSVSRCSLSKGYFAIMIEKPFCHQFGQKGRMTGLVENSLILLRECSRHLHASFNRARKVVKYVKLPERDNHSTVLTVFSKPGCDIVCNRYKFTLLEYITHAGVLCEYTIDVQGHKTMTFVSVYTQEPFLMTLKDDVANLNKHKCARKRCFPYLTKTVRYKQSSTNNRFQDFSPFTKRYVVSRTNTTKQTICCSCRLTYCKCESA